MASAAVMAVTKRSIQAQKNRVPADTKTIGNLEQYSLSAISALAERAVAALVPG
jgi:hypothetical protein